MSTDSTPVTALLRLLQARDVLVAQIAGELSAVHGLAMNDVLMMIQLDAAPGDRLTRVDLAKRLHVSPATVTRMAAPMEKLGFVTREKNARDARLAFVQLTQTGRRRLAETRATLQKRADRIFSDRWSEEEVKNLADFLARFVVNTPGALVDGA